MDTTELLFKRFYRLNGIVRTDLLAVDTFSCRADHYEENGMDLFWSVWRPEAVVFTSTDPFQVEFLGEVAPLPLDIEEMFVDRLAELERTKRVGYRPDVDPHDDPEDPDACVKVHVYAHVAAARAFALQRKVGYSDDVRDCLERAWWCGYLLTEGVPGCVGDPAFAVSTFALSGLVLVELFRVRWVDGRYEEALHFLANGLRYLSQAIAGADSPLDDSYDDIESDQQWRTRLAPFLFPVPLDPQEPVTVVGHVLNHSRTRNADWKQVAKDCQVVAEEWGECSNQDDISDEAGNRIPWQAFWYRAQGRAEEKLNPSDLRDLLNQREDEAAESRLRVYFFETRVWDELPERTRRSLVDAERTWFATRAGRIESVLGHLKVAIESLCYYLFWEPLRRSKSDKHVLEFVYRDEELRQEGRNPSLSDYAWMCRRPFFATYLATQNLSEDDRTYLKRTLPDALDRLGRLRNPAEHDPAHTPRSEEVSATFKEFLGVGCRGILPRLAEINARCKRKRWPRAR